MDRRSFLQSAAIAGLISGEKTAAAWSTKLAASRAEEWKLDVVLYDRSGWAALAYLPPIQRENGEILVGFDAQNEGALTDDFYTAHSEWIFVSSCSGAKSWRQIPSHSAELNPYRNAQFATAWPVRLPDGTLINVIDNMLTLQEQKQRLDTLGIGDLWHPDSRFDWDLWPASFAERLKAEGLMVFDKQGPWLPAGVVATHARPLVVAVSSDGGATWKTKPIEGLPEFSRVVGWFRRGVVLPDGTVLGPIYGQIKGEGSRRSWDSDGTYILRSEDRGNSWRLITLAYDPSGKQGFNETDLFLLPNGRILAMIRNDGEGARLYQSYSDDGGRTWTPPVPTKIPGSPAHVTSLRSGNLLCTYRYEGYNGYRAVLSWDKGKSWDLDNEKILLDDLLPGSLGYPTSMQLNDGTIFTLYNGVKPGPPRPGDQRTYKSVLSLQPPLHSYLAGSIYTENFVKPLGISGK
mgnify:CR=1 FL=1